MASNTQTKVQKGYDHKFVDPVPNELLCLICLFTARDPQQSTCCGKVFCRTCVNELKKHYDKCPGCRGDINCFTDKRSDRNIKALKIECDNAHNGCEWIDELRSLDKHLIACDYTLLHCPNECEDGDKILRKDMETHKAEECPRRQYICPHCDESGEYEERTTTHLEECPLKEIPCSNDGCCEHILRCDILTHFDVCEFQTAPCKYATLGCEVVILRKHLEEHESDNEQHIHFVMNAVSEHEDILHSIKHTKVPLLQEEIVKLREITDSLKDDITKLNDSQKEMIKQQKNTLARLQSIMTAQSKEISDLKLKLESHCQACAPTYDTLNVQWQPPILYPVSNHQNMVVFKFIDYAARKSRDASVLSPPIYSSPGGYKMCINIHPNGSGKGKTTHVSVFAFLMRGENDDHLTWPFTGTVVFELLNQLTDQNHHSMITTMRADHTTSQRVLEGDRAKNGYGHPLFIAHSTLDYNAANNCQYLKDDCLYFRFKINSAISLKSWLSSADVF